jgi:hypothetical protein
LELAVKSSDIIYLHAITGSLRSFEFLFLLFDFPEESCDQVIPGSFDVDGAEVVFPNVKVEKGKSEVALKVSGKLNRHSALRFVTFEKK